MLTDLLMDSVELKISTVFSSLAPGYRRIAFGATLIAWFCLGFSPALKATAPDPSDLFLKAYQEFQNGELLEKKSAPDQALAKYRYTASLLSQIQKTNPDWQPVVVSYRLRKTRENIGRLGLSQQHSPFFNALNVSQKAQNQIITLNDTPSLSITPPLGNSLSASQDAGAMNSPRSEVKTLRLQLNQAFQENQRLNAAITTAQAEKQSALVEIDKIKVSLIEAKSQNSEAQGAAGIAREQAERMARLQESYKTRLANLQKRIDALDGDNSVLAEENEQLLSKLNRAAAYIGESDKIRESLTKDRLSLYKSEYAVQNKLKRIKDNTKVVEELKNTNKELSAKNSDLSQKLASNQTAIEQANTRVQNAEAEIKKLSAQNSLLSTQLVKNKEKIEKLQRDQSETNNQQMTELNSKDSVLTTSNNTDSHSLNASMTALKKDGAPPQSPTNNFPVAIPTPAPPLTSDKTAKPTLTPEQKSLAKQAELAFKEGRFTDCETLYKRLVEKNPNNVSLLANLGTVQIQLSKYTAAEHTLRKALALNPTDPFVTTTLGILQLKCAQIESAIETLQNSVKLDSQNFSAHNYLGIAYGEMGRLEDAEKELKAAIELNPNYATAHFNLAVLYSTQKLPNKELARKHYLISTNLGTAPDPALERLIH